VIASDRQGEGQVKCIPLSAFCGLLFLVGCASQQQSAEQQAAQERVYAYDHARCVAYGWSPSAPEYNQCRLLLAQMRGGGPEGTLAGATLHLMVGSRQVPEGSAQGGPPDFASYGVPVGELERRPAPAMRSLEPTPRIRTGTGFYVSREGHVITNLHVAGGCSRLETQNRIQLKLVGSDAKIDLALLQAVDRKPSAVASFRDSDPTMGESVSVFGFPLPGVLSTSGNLTTGIVAATSGIGDDPHNLQISAPVQPGNSGGPLLDRYGNVIGVVVSKLNANEIAQVTGDIPQNVNFAIKGGEVLPILDKNM